MGTDPLEETGGGVKGLSSCLRRLRLEFTHFLSAKVRFRMWFSAFCALGRGGPFALKRAQTLPRAFGRIQRL